MSDRQRTGTAERLVVCPHGAGRPRTRKGFPTLNKLRIVTLLVTLAAVLALASTALAKGGTASCAQIVDFAVTQGSVDAQPTLTTSYTVDNACFDHENMSAAALDYSNSATAFVGRAVNMLPYGRSTYTSNVVAVTPGVIYTTTLTVYSPNGKVAATQTVSVTAG